MTRRPMKINTHALEKLANYSWPGNVRELQHSIEKAVIMSDSLSFFHPILNLNRYQRPTPSHEIDACRRWRRK